MTDTLTQIIEAALLTAHEPLSLDRLQHLFEEGAAPSKAELKAALQALATSCEQRSFYVKEVASGYCLQIKDTYAPWVSRMAEKPQRYSRALLETLVIIAYRQPVTRAEIEDIRGVAVSSQIMKNLLDRDWIRVVGHRDLPGRPSLYATTHGFLDYFNLKSLSELPPLMELRPMDNDTELTRSLEATLAAKIDVIDAARNSQPEALPVESGA